MVPLMKSVTLTHHWLSTAAFDQAIAMGQITPGPVAISATFIGERVAGPLGALVATIAVFMPSLVFMVVLTHWYQKFKAIAGVQNVLFATLAGVVGLIAAVTVNLGETFAHSPEAWLLVGAVALAASRTRMPYWAIVLAAGLVGTVGFRP